MDARPTFGRPPKMEYQPGDEAYIAIGEELELVRCTVALQFKTPWHTNFFYVLQVMDDEHQHMEVRDALLMSETAEGPLPIWNKKVT